MIMLSRCGETRESGCNEYGCGNQWNRTQYCQRHWVTGQLESPEVTTEKQFRGWDTRSILFLYHCAQVRLLFIISSVVWATVVLKSKLLWSPPTKLSWLWSQDGQCLSMLTNAHLQAQHHKSLLFIFTIFLIFFPHSFYCLSNPSLSCASFHWGFEYFHNLAPKLLWFLLPLTLNLTDISVVNNRQKAFQWNNIKIPPEVKNPFSLYLLTHLLQPHRQKPGS